MSARHVDITIKGEASGELVAMLGLPTVAVGGGVTRLRADARDPTTVDGLLDRLDDLGLELLDLRGGIRAPTRPDAAIPGTPIT
ncbi:hypothetical protein [Desertimonas flava]|uniref:hypothetical protein n=1 Tax=Desertimonas flava TaxID=2064846 RepID=UPI000E3464FC|nr:hypothetical protein [Desertimonas flava]